ncbi:TIGR02996 domain-containing protein [Pyxidicoccus sp. 3LG]
MTGTTPSGRASSQVREELLAKVYADPDDDSARLVLSDYLMEQGDPLGEFIMLQCSPQPDKARLTELLREHRMQLQAELGSLVDPGPTQFERGFPVAVRMSVQQRWALSPPMPAWSTVQDIDWSWTGPPEAADWLAHPHLRRVTRLRRMRAAIARRLGLHALALRRLELQGRLTLQGSETFTVLSELPYLSWVELPDAEPRDVGLCASSPLARRLERFEVSEPGGWSLHATPSEQGSAVVATLKSAKRCGVLVEAIRAAAGFGARVLRLDSTCRLETADMRRLEAAGADYARVRWG